MPERDRPNLAPLFFVREGDIIGKPPAFQLYASDFYMDTSGWTVGQVGAYTRLLMYEWVNGGIPSDMASISRIAGISDARTMYKMWSGNVGKKFMSNGGNLLINKRLEDEREKQVKRREIQAQKGFSGAQKRWKDHIAPAIAQAQPEDNSSSSTSSSSSKDKKNKEYIIYGEFSNVKLTESEHKKLLAEFGEQGTKDRIENISQYIASKGKRYSSHYATILSWERKNYGANIQHTGKSNKEACRKYDGIGTTIETG